MTRHLPQADYPRFHLAFPVTDLAEARRFYGTEPAVRDVMRG
jgi:extradiol dioxygenase family protein